MDSNRLNRLLCSVAPRNPGSALFALVLLASSALSAAGCAWSQPPSQSDATIAPYTINGATEKVDAGQLFLVEKGLWAFLPEASSKEDYRFEPGALVGFLPQKSHTKAHVYGVVLARSWGVLLQRLDSQPVSGTAQRGAFVAIDSDPKFRRWGLCRGASAKVSDNACVQAAALGTQWRIFRTDPLGKIETPELDAWGPTLPIQSAGLRVDERAVMRPGAEPSGHWLAVPAHRPERSRVRNAPSIAHARVATQPNCPAFDFSQSFQPLEVFSADIDAPQDAIDTTTAAIRTGADLLVRCEGDTIWIDIPFLYRPTLAVADTSAKGVAYGAMHPIVLKGASTEAQRATILMGAALATGSTFVADFYLEEALRATAGTRAARDLGLRFMQVFAAAGRPEAALRSGHAAADGAWHLENHPQFILGRSWVDAALGKARAYSDDITRLNTLAEAPENSDIRLWLAWNVIRAEPSRAGGRSARGALSFFEEAGLIRWLEAANLIVAPSISVEIKEEQAGALRQQLERVFEPVSAQSDTPSDTPTDTPTNAKNCAEAGTCQFDVYGRNFAARLEALRSAKSDAQLLRFLRDLSQTAIASTRPEFQQTPPSFEGFSAPEELAIRAALMPMLHPELRAQRFDALIATATRAVSAQGNCVHIPGASIIARRLEAPPQDGSAQQSPYLRATHWLVRDAFEAACNSPIDFAQSLERSFGRDEAMARQVIPLLSALSAHTSPQTRAQMLSQVADFSAAHKTGAACTRFNLALAFSNARAGHLQAAAENLSKTVNCAGAQAEPYAPSQRLLNAYIQFETSAQIPAGLAPETYQAMVALTRTGRPASPETRANAPATCFGLAPIAYPLAAYLHPDIIALAVSLPEREPDALALETSSRSVERARAALMVAQRYLAEGQPQPAANALLEARAAFDRINHQVGLRRVAFLSDTIFGADLDGYQKMQAQGSTASTATAPPTPVSLDAPEKLSAPEWSKALQQGQADVIAALFSPSKLPRTPESTRAWTAAKLLSDTGVPFAQLGGQQSALELLCE